MRLRHALVFVLIGIFFGGGGWWWYQQRTHNPQLRSIALDESLASTQVSEATELPGIDPQHEALLSHVLALPGAGLTDLPVNNLQPPFLRPACYVSAVDTCLVSVAGYEVSGRYIVQLDSKPARKSLNKPDLAFAMGRILGEPDQVRKFLVNEYGSLTGYFAFVRYIQAVSLENHISPALVYSLYDYLLFTAEGAQQPLATLPSPQQLTDQINTSLSAYNRGEEPEDTVSSQFSTLDTWSSEDKALAAGLARSLIDADLIVRLLEQPGNFDLHYYDRIQSTFDNKPFEASFSGPNISEDDYRQVQQEPGQLAACRRDRAGLCHLEGPDSDGLWHLTCRWAPFLDEFCDGSLPVL